MLIENLYETEEIEKLKNAITQNDRVHRLKPKTSYIEPFLLIDQHAYLYLNEQGEICLHPTAFGKIYAHLDIPTASDHLTEDFFSRSYGISLSNFGQFTLKQDKQSAYLIEILTGGVKITASKASGASRKTEAKAGDILFIPTFWEAHFSCQRESFLKITQYSIDSTEVFYAVQTGLTASRTDMGEVVLTLGHKEKKVPSHLSDVVYWIISQGKISSIELHERFPNIDHEKILHDLLKMKILTT